MSIMTCKQTLSKLLFQSAIYITIILQLKVEPLANEADLLFLDIVNIFKNRNITTARHDQMIV
jgi:hypothetical protein